MLTNVLAVLILTVLCYGAIKMSKLSDSVDNLSTAVTNELAAIKAVLAGDTPDVTAAIAKIDALAAALNEETAELQPTPNPPSG